ncbi:MAG: hypothetical protein PF636_12560 [Actinomycetota bacterium]|jgi:hypothetical protein|nr:hypothetical protein [Actinomycetota bacterium]
MDSEVTEVVATIIEDDDPTYPTHMGSGPPSGGCLSIGAGIVLMLVGVPMLVCPGPGIATLVLGFGLVLRGLGVRPPSR